MDDLRHFTNKCLNVFRITSVNERAKLHCFSLKVPATEDMCGRDIFENPERWAETGILGDLKANATQKQNFSPSKREIMSNFYKE